MRVRAAVLAAAAACEMRERASIRCETQARAVDEAARARLRKDS